MKKVLFLLIVLVAAIQLATPGVMIAKHERTLREGEVFKFKTTVVDPYDAFRGRYVRLAVQTARVPFHGESLPHKRRGTVFAELDTDENGFAYVRRASRRAPEEGAYITVKDARLSQHTNLSIRLPIERFYLPEGEAPRAEVVYAQAASDRNREAVVVARVLNGNLVLENLLIDGVPIREWIATASTKMEN
ncbi:MAG: GDYXXLXY domain-containing protein [Kiritimatiellae bacterium]|nr:GDYXXLXY domain-containing protein [Kiritimatiellia bacterium]